MTEEKKYNDLVMKSKDCGVFYGLESPEYEKAIKELNDFLLSQEQKEYNELSFFKKLNYNRKYGHNAKTVN